MGYEEVGAGGTFSLNDCEVDPLFVSMISTQNESDVKRGKVKEDKVFTVT